MNDMVSDMPQAVTRRMKASRRTYIAKADYVSLAFAEAEKERLPADGVPRGGDPPASATM